MFKRIGKKIKTLAKVVCWIGIIQSVLIAMASFVCAALINSTAITAFEDTAATGLIGESVALIVIGILILLLGPLCSWIGSFVLYGYGELIDKCTSIENYLLSQNQMSQEEEIVITE